MRVNVTQVTYQSALLYKKIKKFDEPKKPRDSELLSFSLFLGFLNEI